MLINTSCLGEPSPTNTMSGLAVARCSAISLICCVSDSKPNSGQKQPATFRSGNACCMFSVVFSAEPGLPPSRNTEIPDSEAAAQMSTIKSVPLTRSGNAWPLTRLAQINGMPSATFSVEVATRLRNETLFLYRRRMSRLGVTTQPPIRLVAQEMT